MNYERARRPTKAKQRGLHLIAGGRPAKNPFTDHRTYTVRRSLLSAADVFTPPVQEVIDRATRLATLVEEFGVSLLPTDQLTFIAQATANELEAKKSLKAVTRGLPDSLDCTIAGVSVLGATDRSEGRKYVSYELSDTSSDKIQEEQAIIMGSFGRQYTMNFTPHINLLRTYNLGLAEHIASELEEASTLPVAIQLGLAQVAPTQYRISGQLLKE